MNLAEFESKWSDLAKTEEGAIKMFLIGALEYVKGNTDGKKMVAVTLPKSSLDDKGLPNKDNQYYLDQLKKTENICGSYLGGTPENGYKYSYDSDLDIKSNSKRGEKESKIFVQSGGKSFASPVHLKKNKSGIWKLFNISSLATGVKRPPEEEDDF